VRIGGVDLRALRKEDIAGRLGVLFQDFAMYEMSVRDNVLMGRPKGDVSEERLRAAIREARADEVVSKLAGGINARVGRMFEGGHDLSGGEWQRLAIARLVYRDADIWVLDEPSSALDPEAEVAVLRQMKERLRGRMGIVISHRFSTVRLADRIALVHDGRIAELGTHDELIALNQRYFRRFELQASSYR
jgi:ATP-binding cassette subfamily B protein